jgi:glutamate synthase (ferredoxin)
VILISGFDGGTGAAPLTSLQHVPWELGLAEAQQTLILNDPKSCRLRMRRTIKTGRDVAVAALLERGIWFCYRTSSSVRVMSMSFKHMPSWYCYSRSGVEKEFQRNPEHIINSCTLLLKN